MVAYSYKGRFVAPIRVGLGLPIQDEHRELGGYQPGQIIRPKTQTIRAIGKRRHARPGETIQHYHAQRSPKCFKVGEAKCMGASAIRVFVHSERVEIRPDGSSSDLVYKGVALDAFARMDGFGDWADMRAFWLEEHGHELKHLGPFIGVLIQWGPL
ncbi:hypothetical protein PMI42_04842 [Bradyrhizobium sp. YR681]|uniref:hypothetical protein n=1 Tax=Bradyrhizobium sp. YR681 TaxID=1144344 RepID=UPI0002710D30|nr:hypothetical protein [Bradyrhizobium sp. YR681]EJN11828.1 hypothetical protein PMI42_04842 [Bradyrhizobium sp. YR681]